MASTLDKAEKKRLRREWEESQWNLDEARERLVSASRQDVNRPTLANILKDVYSDVAWRRPRKFTSYRDRLMVAERITYERRVERVRGLPWDSNMKKRVHAMYGLTEAYSPFGELTYKSNPVFEMIRRPTSPGFFAAATKRPHGTKRP